MRTEKLDLCKICGKMFLKTRDTNACPICAPQKYPSESTAQSESLPVASTKNEESMKKSFNERENKRWSQKYDCCVNCGRNDVKHVARGLCLNCYQGETEKRNRGARRLEKGLASYKLNRKYLYGEYVNKGRSLIDIAKDCNCSRQFIYKKMRDFNISLRTLKEARKLALDREKIAFKIIGQDGNERLVIPGSIEINEDFFKHWSNEMAYVLGVIYTDGHINPGHKLDPSQKTTTMSPRLVIVQKEPELLRKVSKLMNCNMELRYKKKRGIAGGLYVFDVCSEKIYGDLTSLGLSPQKSKTMEFPSIPMEFARHFIRGCWDGDGSVFFRQRQPNCQLCHRFKKVHRETCSGII